MAADADDLKKLDSFVKPGPESSAAELSLGDRIAIDENSLTAIKSGYVIERDLDVVLKLVVDKSPGLFPSFINRLPTLSGIKNLIKHIVNYFKKDCSPNQEMVYKRLTQAQMLALGSEYKDLTDLGINFVNELYHKSYPEHPTIDKIKDVSLIKKVYQWSLNSKMSAAYPGLKRKILKVLLSRLIKQNVVEPEFFEDFIKNPSDTDDIFSKKVMKKWAADYSSFNFIAGDDIEIAQTVTSYLKLLFASGADIGRYFEFFNPSYFSKLQAELQLKNGERIERVLEVFTKAELDFLNEEKYLVFADKKSDYAPSEPVCLKLEVKNIKKVILKLFEINTGNYCRELKKNPDNDAKLDGLLSISEKTFSYDQPSIVAHRQLFELDSLLNKQRGVFVADFLGEGLGSRAIIRKGHLTLILGKTRTGYACKILDEQYNVCKGEDTGLYLEDKFYKAGEEGAISFEYRSSTSTYSIILQHEGFCYVVSQSLEAESIDFNCTWLYSEETFLPGNRSSMILRTSMFVSGIQVPTSNIKETKVEVEFSRPKNVKSYQKFESLTLKEGEDTEIGFYLPNGTRSILVRTEYSYMSLKGVSETRSFSEVITLRDREGSAAKTHFFVRKEAADYFLYHLGKNGEPVCGTEVSVALLYIWKRDRETHSLATDEKGRINLGPLAGVTLVEAHAPDVKNENLSTFFNLWNPSSSIGISSLVITEGESVQLPVLAQFESFGIETVLQKVNKSKKTLIEDLSKQVSKRGSFYVVDQLPVGDYVFRYTKSNKKVDISVVAGRYLNEELIQTGNLIYKTAHKKLFISNIVGESFDRESQSLELLLDRYGPDTRVHVFSQTFLEEGHNKTHQVDRLNANGVGLEVSKISKTAEPKLSYLQDRQLAGEMIYAMNRRTNEPAIGTTSEKPAMFLKRQEVRDTHFMSEEVDHGGDYGEVSESSDEAEDAESVDSFNNYGKKPTYAFKRKAGGGRGHPRANFFEPTDDYSNAPQVYSGDGIVGGSFVKLRHFLKVPSVTLANLKPDSQGKVKVPLDQVHTRSLRVFVVNKDRSTAKTIDLGESADLQLQDLRLQTASDPHKAFAYEREVYKIREGLKEKIPGFSSCEYELIDSISKLLSIKTDLSGDIGRDWDFLKNWSTLKIGQKLKTLDERFSYETAVFLFKRDRDFFDMTLADFLKCKMNKTLLDHYLLGDKEALKQFLTAEKAAKMNTLERICLLDALPEMHLADLFAQIQGEDAANSYEGSLLFTKLFDRIVSSADKTGEKVEVRKRDKAYEAGEYDDNFNDLQADDDECSAGSCEEQGRMKAMKREENRARDRKERVHEEAKCEEEIDFGAGLFDGADECEQQQAIDYDMYAQQECEMPMRNVQQRARPVPRRAPQNRRAALLSNSFGSEECGGGGGGEEEDEDHSDEEEDQKYDMLRIKKRRREPNVTKLQQSSMKVTKEYREIGYYFQRKDQASYKVQANLFWVDLARHLLSRSTEPFMSENFIYVDNQHLPFVVAFFGLPEQPAQPSFTSEGSDTFIELKGGNSLLFLKHLKERDPVPDNSQTILSAQKWFDRDERFEYNLESGQQEEKHIDYFIKGKIYGSQVVVTNVSSVEQKIQIITEVPRGAIPVYYNDYHQSYELKLSQFSTQQFEFFFYFPVSGSFSYCPACVTREGKKVVVQSSTSELRVLDEHPKKTELKSIKDILAQGSKEDILNFMRKENINNEKVFSFADIYWLLKDEEFYRGCIGVLRERMIFNPVVWSYAYLHGDLKTVIDTLTLADSSEQSALQLTYFNSSSEKWPLQIKNFKFLEYHPIVNARFHQMSKEKNSILNQQLFDTYLSFLKYYFEREELVDDEDRLILTYYLLLQDRIDEALLVFNTIPASSPFIGKYQIQHDYMVAYFDLYKGMPEFSKAKVICEKYLDYSVLTWRSLFIEIANQLAEFEGESAENSTKKEKASELSEAPLLRAKIQDSSVILECANIDSVKVEFFEIDLEVLFSLYPFLSNEFEQLVFSQPHHTLVFPVNKTAHLQSMPLTLPEQFTKKNLIIKVAPIHPSCLQDSPKPSSCTQPARCS